MHLLFISPKGQSLFTVFA